jgi:hypothetical protein
VTGPTDEELRTDGAHRVVVANYRRFVDDYMSRRYGEIERLVRRLGCKQLLGARSGYGGTGNHWADALLPVDVATGVVHFDFTSPEGYGLTGSLDQFYEGGFLTAYARGVSAGKPVVWVEFGCSVGQNPQRIDLDNQARIYRNMTELAERSHAAGMFGWWYPGGWRVDERSDFGIVNPDSTLRPAAIEYAKSRRDPSRPSDWNQREVDPAADARGLSALWDRWRATYREQMRRGEVQEVRLASFGKLTSELAPAAVGGRPYEAPAPLAYVNAEWGRVEVNGAELPRSPAKSVRLPANATVRVELINTGPATWDSAFVQDQPLAHTPFGQRVWISLAAPLSGVVRVRPELKGVGPFGEPLEIEITE